MTRELILGPHFHLPLTAVTERLAFLGRTGSGKTYAAQKLAEEMHRADAQFVVLDPVGVWYGLRLAADGKAPGLPVPVLGGLYGDIPLEVGAGALIANLVVDRGVSMVLDVSQFESDADKARFAQAFADRFFFRKKASPSAVHLFIEEAQEFCPQNPQREEARMLHAFTRMVKIGRNFGIGISLITQRPQEVNKKVLNLTELLFCFQLTGPHERKTVEGWIAEKGIDEDIAGELPKLDVGQPHVWSPAWLKISKLVRIASKRTLDVSSTPTVGQKAAARDLSPIDLERLRKEMLATIEKAKAEDPRELRRELAAVRAELSKALANMPKSIRPKEKRVEIPILKDAQIKRIEVLGTRMITEAMKHGKAMAMFWEEQESCWRAILDALKSVVEGHKATAFPPAAVVPIRPPASASQRFFPRSIARIEQAEEMVTPSAPLKGGPQERILGALNWWRGAGIDSPTRHQVAFVAGYTINGHFNNTLGNMRTEGLIGYPGSSLVVLTAAGAKLAGPVSDRASWSDLVARVRTVLRDEPRRRVFDVLTKATEPLTREDLAQAAGYTVNGHFNNTLGSLNSLGVVVYPTSGHVALSSLFDGLA